MNCAGAVLAHNLKPLASEAPQAIKAAVAAGGGTRASGVAPNARPAVSAANTHARTQQ